MRRLHRERWRIAIERASLDENGYGRVLYAIDTPQARLSFFAVSNPLAPEERTDRVIAEKWDAAFVLVHGSLGRSAMERLAGAIPRQEMARYGAGEIVLSRANKSVRLFDLVVEALAAGRQPPLAELVRIGYLMRTTAVYGNGKFGLADFDLVRERGVFRLPFQAEMLTVYLAREFSMALVEYIARVRGGTRAVRLDARSRRALGVGNATGLGMAPFLVSHPKLINAWILARETALGRVRSVAMPAADHKHRLSLLVERARRHLREWQTEDERQLARITVLRGELDGLAKRLASGFPKPDYPWDRLARWAEESLSAEGAELVNSLLIELHPELVDDLEETTVADEDEEGRPSMPVSELLQLIERRYGWALAIDPGEPAARQRFWYRSAEKDEPRLGDRYGEPGAELEMPLAIAVRVAELHQALIRLPAERIQEPVAALLLARPELRGIVRRVQALADLPYAEIRDNLIGRDCLPIDLLRCKLSIFGASKFDPKSDRWIRITLFQGAPCVAELALPDADDWLFPALT